MIKEKVNKSQMKLKYIYINIIENFIEKEFLFKSTWKNLFFCFLIHLVMGYYLLFSFINK